MLTTFSRFMLWSIFSCKFCIANIASMHIATLNLNGCVNTCDCKLTTIITDLKFDNNQINISFMVCTLVVCLYPQTWS